MPPVLARDKRGPRGPNTPRASTPGVPLATRTRTSPCVILDPSPSLRGRPPHLVALRFAAGFPDWLCLPEPSRSIRFRSPRRRGSTRRLVRCHAPMAGGARGRAPAARFDDLFCSVHTPEFTTPSAALQPLRRLTNRRCAIDHDQADADNLVAPCTHVGPGLSSRPPATSRMDGGALT